MKNLFDRYIWLVDTIYRAGKITFEDLNKRWLRNELSEGKELPLRTFHNHRIAIEEMFSINIECDKRNGYAYYIENKDDIERGGVRSWLLNTFAVNNLINESHPLKRRILFEQIPSGQHFLTSVIEAMRDGLTLELTYRSFWQDEPNTFDVEPYCLKIFRQRWYLLARNLPYDAIRTYSLDRIQAIRTTDTPFKLPKDFHPETYFENYFGIIADKEIEPCVLKIKVYGVQQRYFQSLPLHHSQEEIET
ncbi:MAG: WYL domain-containing protein, partial [Dysgonamonadaceae bacterium]|nr:WYL domain-containing protein [Dysgonamonadaceae bacterium]